MITPSEPASLLFALALFAFSAAGCGGENNGSNTLIDPEVVVEFRSEATQRTHTVDIGIAALEAEGASADSATGVAFQQTINELLESRHVLQQGLGSLDTLTVAQFDVVSDSLSEQLETLELRVDRAPFELTQDMQALKDVAASHLTAVFGEIDELQAGADSTLDAALTSLEQRGHAFADSLNVSSEDDLENLRTMVATELRRLRSALDSIRFESASTGLQADSAGAN